MYYTELIILEYRDRTDLADGKYDGKTNMQDATQIELIIPGKEKELTIVDAADSNSDARHSDREYSCHVPCHR